MSREIVTQLIVEYKQDCKAVIDAYVEVESSIDEDFINGSVKRRQNYVYLHQLRNRQGSIKCFGVDIGR